MHVRRGKSWYGYMHNILAILSRIVAPKHNFFPTHQGNCDDCKKKGPNIWACLQVCEGYMNKVLKLVGKLCGRKNGQEQVIKFPPEFDKRIFFFFFDTGYSLVCYILKQ